MQHIPAATESTSAPTVLPTDRRAATLGQLINVERGSSVVECQTGNQVSPGGKKCKAL